MVELDVSRQCIYPTLSILIHNMKSILLSVPFVLQDPFGLIKHMEIITVVLNRNEGWGEVQASCAVVPSQGHATADKPSTVAPRSRGKV